uniref:Alternative protein WDR65 n=1 Tax=Homo sapiens TaxID=9606 RepID=L8EAQ1_HUMAN|nr:alternative protein WDR65 [Homo sapiens]
MWIRNGKNSFQAQRRVRACWPCPSVPIGGTSLSLRLCKKNLPSPFMNCHPSLAGSAKFLIILTSKFRNLLAWLFLQTPNTYWLRRHLQSQILSTGCGKNRK